ncbi:MAG: type I polyketide synthase, partial [Herbaspirillum sp.]|uniref:type I polyketide synthase n=1 Tax=Herbaspirillum sp. TaxID=1890675 RepID=UPI0025853DA9
GVTVQVPQNAGSLYQEGGILSPDGHCRPFDAASAGTVGGNGAGVVVLKRLADALADGDSIHAVIRGSAINNDGAFKVGFAAPSVDGQVAVITKALARAGVEPETIDFVECHGTGTALGDPIEAAALNLVFRGDRPRRSCAIGSAKSNFGHLDAAAGVAGLIKAALALEHRRIPPTLHFREPNPEIDFDAGPLYVASELVDWPRSSTPPRAAVSALGLGGTNAHVVLEAVPERPPEPAAAPPWQLVVLSARTGNALEGAAARLAEHLERHPELPPADVASTLQVGRRAFEHRLVVAAADLADAARVLSGGDPPRVFSAVVAKDADPRMAFMFSGQGSQHVDMGRDLYETEPRFRREVDRVAEMLAPRLGVDLRRLMYPGPGDEDEAARQLRRIDLGQPALFVVEHALARLWMAWGIRPEAMIGHSVGEYVAACVAEVFSLE